MAKQDIIARTRLRKAGQFMSEGRYGDAVHQLESYCRTHPRQVDTWIMLATAYGRLWNFDAAREACAQALSLDPENPHGNSVMGNILAALGHHQEAQTCFQAALRHNPEDPSLLNNLGTALYLAGQLEEAAEVLEKVTELNPDYANARNNLGNVYRLLNRNMEAIRHFGRAIELDPSLVEAHLNLGKIFSDRVTRPDEAEQCFRRVLQLDPENFEAWCCLGKNFRFRGRLDEALDAIRHALQISPGNPTARGYEAELFELQGQREKAFLQACELVESESRPNLRATLILTRQCTHHGSCEQAIEYAHALLEDENLLYESRRELHFALGKLYDKLGRYDEAFQHLLQGNDLVGVPFDMGETRKFGDRLLAVYTPDMLEKLPRAHTTETSKRLIFIVGMPRSGTSLTEQILASHPDVYAAGERNDINDIAFRMPGFLDRSEPYPDCLPYASEQALESMAGRYLEIMENLAGDSRRITDKMPHNFLNLGLIALLFPGARVIHCNRDARDTCLSLFMQDFGWLHPYSTRLEHLGAYHLEYQRIMNHWRSVLDIPMLEINYEDLVADQEGVSRRIIDFAGLEWNERCLRFDKIERFVPTASYDQVRQPIYRGSVQRWKNYRDHLGPLLRYLGADTNAPEPATCGDTPGKQ